MPDLIHTLIGEPLVEFSPERGGDLFHRRTGGDTLNTAIYLSRLVRGRAAVSYVTRLGDDPQSEWLISCMAAEGIRTDRIVRSTGRRPGLYLIHTDPAGERSFTYWRSDSPARALYDRPDVPQEDLSGSAMIYVSGITLAVMAEEARARLVGAMDARRRDGALVVFDTNYRPVLWPTASAASHWMTRAMAASNLVMPSFEDLALMGLSAGDPGDAMSALESVSDGAIVLRTGGGPILLGGTWPAQEIDPGPRVAPTDTTGAGDSFNAGFIAARLAGRAPEPAVAFAHRLASRVVRTPGAILPPDAMADLVAELTPQQVSGAAEARG